MMLFRSELLCLIVLIFSVYPIDGYKKSTLSDDAGKAYMDKHAKKAGVIVLPSGLQYRVIKSSTLEDAKSPNITSVCHVHYRGTTVKGHEFDSSYKRGNKPTQFKPKGVIRGWAQALKMMKEGDKWEVVIPAELAYGQKSLGEYITPGSVLIFEVELVQVDQETDNPYGLISSWREVPFAFWFFGAYLLYSVFCGAWGVSKPKFDIKTMKEVEEAPGNKKVFFDVFIGDSGASTTSTDKDDTSVQRIEMLLFNSLCPKTAQNFLSLCIGDRGIGRSGKPLHYSGSSFHRVINDFMAQGGDFTTGDGRGGESIYGTYFADEYENGGVEHSEPYLLSMANRGPNTNGSQFFITFKKVPHLDGKHVVFGKVVKGQDVVDQMNRLGSMSGTPKKSIKIVNCGETEMEPSLRGAQDTDDKKHD